MLSLTPSIFFAVMRLQIHKHNNRYLKGVGLVRSIFGETKTGVIIAKFIANKVPTSVELEEYYSKIHRTNVNAKAFYTFLKININDEALELLKSNTSYLLHANDIKPIISGLDIWNSESTEAKRIKKIAKTFYAAHPSTQHNNERLVKIASRMARTGKKEVTANYFFIAANSFIGDNNDEGTEGNADDGGDDHNDGDDDGGNNGGDGGSVYDYRRRKRDKGTKKVCDMERNLFKIETDINNIAKSNPNFNADAKFVAETLASSNVIKKDSDKRKVDKLMASFDERKTNARMKKIRGGLVLPLFNGYVQYSKLCSRKNFNKKYGVITQEFEARGMLDKLADIRKSGKRMVTQCVEAIGAHEKKRFETEVVRELTAHNAEFTPSMKVAAKLALLKQIIEENEDDERDWSAYEVDIKKYFKKQSNAFTALSLLTQDD